MVEWLIAIKQAFDDAFADLAGWVFLRWTALSTLIDERNPVLWARWLLPWAVVLSLVVLTLRYRKLPARWATRALVLLARHPRIQAGAMVRLATLLQSILPITLVLWVCERLVLWLPLWPQDLVWLRQSGAWVGAMLWLGNLLHGLVRPISRGRPALLPVGEHEAERVLRQFRWAAAGLLALVAVRGVLHMNWPDDSGLNVEWVIAALDVSYGFGLLLGLGLGWRQTLAQAWQERAGAGLDARMANLMDRRILGTSFFGVAILRLLGGTVVAALLGALQKGGVTAVVQAFLLRQRRPVEQTVPRGGLPLLSAYRSEFSPAALGPNNPALGLLRNKTLGPPLDAIQAWRERDSQEGSMVMVAEKGGGKSSLLWQIESELGELPVLRDAFVERALSESAVIDKLRTLVGCKGDGPEALIETLMLGPMRVVLLDDAHNVFLRTIDGYSGFGRPGTGGQCHRFTGLLGRHL